MVSETIQLSQNSLASQPGPVVKLEMSKLSLRQIQSFKPFLECSTPEQKLAVLTKTSVFKPKRRVQKLIEKK
jgi:hypothetical protein